MKKITSLSLGISFLIMSYTGIMLFVAPQGKIAYWSSWQFLGLTKTEYGNLHTTSMVLMLFFSILHIYYNWKPIVSYLKDKSKKISFTKKEFVIAIVVNAIFVVGTLLIIEPFKSFLAFNDGIKNYWELKLGNPPYPHAEESRLRVFCKKIGVDLDFAKKLLEAQKIKFNENETLKDIANNNSTTPNSLYLIIKPKKGASSINQDTPPKLGRKTLEELAQFKKINLEKSLELLRSKGLESVSKNDTIKNIADELELKPIEVYQLLKL